MSRIFISYRRSDSISESGRIHDHLEREFGGRNVFKDVDDIPPGLDFRKVLDEEVSRCDVLLAIIGDKWATASDANGNQRLQNPDDFVRIEVESGLRRGDEVLVIPVLVNNATMPSIKDLPESLHDLTYRNAVIVRNDPDFNRDMRRLIDYIYRYRKNNRSNRLPMLIGGAVIALVLIVALGFVFSQVGDPLPPAVTLQSTTPPEQPTQPTATAESATLESGDRDTAESLSTEAQELASNGYYGEAYDTYTEAITTDPTYAEPYVGRALVQSSGYSDFESAIDDLEKAIELDPSYAEAFKYLGQFNLYEDNIGDIEPNLARAIELNPSDIEARMTLAEYFISVGRYYEAGEQYQAILDDQDNIDPEKVYEAQVGVAYTQQGLGNIEEAIDLYQAAIDMNPERIEAYTAMGNIYVYRGDYEQAIGFLDTAIDKNNENPDAFYNRGLAHLEMERYTVALADFDRALQLRPDNPLAYVGRGRVYIELDNYVSAIADFSQAITREGDYGAAYYWRGIAHYHAENSELAIADFTEAIDLDSFTGQAYAYRGLSYFQDDDHDSAQTDLETALEYGLTGQLQYDALLELGWITYSLADDTDALDYFAQTITLQPENPNGYVGHIAVLLAQVTDAESDSEQLNHLLSALDSANRAIDQIDDSPNLFVQRAEIYQWLAELNENDAEQFELAIADATRAIELDDTSTRAYHLLAESMMMSDAYSFEDALPNAQTAYELDDTNPDILDTLAEIHEELSNTDDAIRLYQLAIDNTEDEDERDYFQSRIDELQPSFD